MKYKISYRNSYLQEDFFKYNGGETWWVNTLQSSKY